MPDFTNTQIPQPGNWQDFQRLCLDLWKRIWDDPGAQINGRPGQMQDGIDIFGRPDQGSSYEGVQCKGKDGRYGHRVTEKELREEVEEAKSFEATTTTVLVVAYRASVGVVEGMGRLTGMHLTA